MKPLGGRFALLREIGSGGMSRVFLGRDEVLDRPVAVKILRHDLGDSGLGVRFQREGRTAAKLSHPNIVRVYDAGEGDFEGRRVSYIVMEYLSGGDLKRLVDRGGALPGAMLTRLGGDVAAGLAHAHERGVIHRDIKPRNVLLDEHGTPKLTDFGVARLLDDGHSTSTDSYLGTAAYSSPEQLRGGGITAKSDVYSLGATLYHAAVGGPPFVGAPLDIATQQMEKPLIPPRSRGASIGENFEGLILDCLAVDPNDRPEAADLHEQLLPAGVAGLAASQTGRGSNGRSSAASGITRAGAAKAAEEDTASRTLGRRIPASGPLEETITLPTRTFRSGARPRATLALITVALVALLLVGAGAWAVLGPNAGEEAAAPQQQNAGQESGAGPSQKKAQKPESPQETADGNQAATGKPQKPETPEEKPAPALPPEQAEQAVFDMYYEMSFATPATSWAFLSERLQNEIGSVEQWAEQEDIYTFEYMDFEGYQYPQATISGNEAEVEFQVRLDHTWGSELLSGTWVCVNEGGEWKLDRLEGEERQTV